MARYQVFNLDITELDVVPIMKAAKDKPRDRSTTNKFFATLMDREVAFTHSQRRYTYMTTNSVGSKTFSGRIGTQRQETETDGPKTQFDALQSDRWHASNVLARNLGKGVYQMAIETDGRVGKPDKLLPELVDILLMEAQSDKWTATAVGKYLINDTIADALKKHKGIITKVSIKNGDIEQYIAEEFADCSSILRASTTITTEDLANGIVMKSIRQTLQDMVDDEENPARVKIFSYDDIVYDSTQIPLTASIDSDSNSVLVSDCGGETNLIADQIWRK